MFRDKIGQDSQRRTFTWKDFSDRFREVHSPAPALSDGELKVADQQIQFRCVKIPTAAHGNLRETMRCGLFGSHKSDAIPTRPVRRERFCVERSAAHAMKQAVI
jgi:hypothetical protein